MASVLKIIISLSITKDEAKSYKKHTTTHAVIIDIPRNNLIMSLFKSLLQSVRGREDTVR